MTSGLPDVQVMSVSYSPLVRIRNSPVTLSQISLLFSKSKVSSALICLAASLTASWSVILTMVSSNTLVAVAPVRGLVMVAVSVTAWSVPSGSGRVTTPALVTYDGLLDAHAMVHPGGALPH